MNTVLASETGRNALETAYVYGKDTVIQKAGYGGRLTNESISGQGETFYRGTMRSDSDVGSQIIELSARATGTDAILKNVLQNEAGKPDSRVRAYLDSANDVFGTVLHEDYHWYNTGTTPSTAKERRPCSSTRWNIWRGWTAMKAWTS